MATSVRTASGSDRIMRYAGNVRCSTQLRLDPVATARGSDTIADRSYRSE